MDRFNAVISRLSQWFDRVAQIALAMMMLVVVANILSRSVWQSFTGTYEIAGYLGAIVIGFALANCAAKDRFIAITIVFERFPNRIQDIINIIVSIMGLGLFIIASVYSAKMATDIYQAGELSPTMRIPFYPLIYVLAFCFLVLGLVLLMNIVKLIVKVVRK